MIRVMRNYLSQTGLGPQVVKAMLGSAGLRILGMALGFLVGVQLARGLGPEDYGVYGAAMAIITVLMVPTELGLPQLVVREMAASLASGSTGAAAEIVRRARRVVVVSAAIMAGGALCILSCDLLDVSPPLRSTLLVGLAWVPIVALGNVYGAALRGMHFVASGQVGEFVVRPLLVSLLLFVASLQVGWILTPASAMAINILSACVAAALSFSIFVKIGAARPVAGMQCEMRFYHALPMAMTEGMRILGAQLSMLMLVAMSSKAEVGIYRVAYAIYTATTLPSALVNVACAPTIARLHAQGRMREMAKLNVWVSMFLVASAGLCVLLGWIFGRDAIVVVFGPAYADAISVLVVFLLGELVAAFFGHPVVALNMMGRQRIVMWWSLVALITNFILSLVLVRGMGYVGAAVGSAVGLVVWRGGCAVYAKRCLGIDTTFISGVIPSRRRVAVGLPGGRD